ncbi:MAG: helix-turn-helix domain-containing protein [Prevotella sp.]|nr:helix-turn-helix domain-containing protein [Prevotella sp.]
MKSRTSLLLLLLMLTPIWVLAMTSSYVFDNFNASHGLADNSAQTLKCTKTGRLVITTMGQINLYDGQRFTVIDPSKENTYRLASYRGNYHLYFDRYHHLWLKDRHSVTCVNTMTEKFVDSVDQLFREFGMEKTVDDLFVSSDGMVWLLSEDGLFSVKHKKNYKIHKNLNLQDLEVWKENNLILFYENGMMEVIDLATGKQIVEKAAYDQKDVERYNSSSVLYVDSTKCYQLRNGKKESILLCLDMEKWEWSTLVQKPYHLNNLEKKDDLLFIPSEYGFWVYNVNDGKMDHFDKLKLASGEELETDVNVMIFDRQGGLWVGTETRGLLYARPYSTPFNVYHWSDKRTGPYYSLMENIPTSASFRDKYVNCVYKDSRGWTWVGTSYGLQLYRKSSDRLPKVITKNDGLLNNVIHSVIEDKMHNIWVSTSYGISCLYFKNKEIVFINSFNRYDNIPEETFVNGHAVCMEDGMVVMQSLDHIITFNPQLMQTALYEYPFDIYPKLTKLLVNGNDIKPGMEIDDNVILEKALSRTHDINLNYNQNSVTLTFSALNYFRPQQTFYRVRVSGVIDEWHVFASYNSHGMVDSRGQLHLPLMNLKPGSYVIEIQTSMTPDKWTTTPYEWVVNINEPWWRTTGILILYFALVLALVALNAYYYLRNANMRALRNSGEQNMVKRIKNFVERCNSISTDQLEPLTEEVTGMPLDESSMLSDEFIAIIEKIMPLVQSKDIKQLTMRELSTEAHIDVQKFYDIISSNIYKSPHPLARKLMLRKAQNLLETTELNVGDIAEQCGFVSANFFIAAFYRQYRMTPAEYRGKM